KILLPLPLWKHILFNARFNLFCVGSQLFFLKMRTFKGHLTRLNPIFYEIPVMPVVSHVFGALSNGPTIATGVGFAFPAYRIPGLSGHGLGGPAKPLRQKSPFCSAFGQRPVGFWPKDPRACEAP